MRDLEVRENVPLAGLTTLGAGGPAQYFVTARNEAQLLEALAWAARYGVRVFILGGGSNVVIADSGVLGLVIQLTLRGRTLHEGCSTVELVAAAGEPWDELVSHCVREGLSGLECLSGIPGSVGATPIQNVGAYGQEVSESVVAVRVLDRRTGHVSELPAAACAFAYRDSLFKSIDKDRYVVLAVRYALTPNGAPAVRYAELERALHAGGIRSASLEQVRALVIELRRRKSMVVDPMDSNSRSCGSFFVNPIVPAEHAAELRAGSAGAELPQWAQPDGRMKLSAAWLIEHAGFSKGQRHGTASISSRHSLALTCSPGGRSSDVVALARRIRAGVEQQFGVRLEPEPAFWGFASSDGLPDERTT